MEWDDETRFVFVGKCCFSGNLNQLTSVHIISVNQSRNTQSLPLRFYPRILFQQTGRRRYPARLHPLRRREKETGHTGFRRNPTLKKILFCSDCPVSRHSILHSVLIFQTKIGERLLRKSFFYSQTATAQSIASPMRSATVRPPVGIVGRGRGAMPHPRRIPRSDALGRTPSTCT